MNKLINDKKFLEELEPYTGIVAENLIAIKNVKDILSKHLRALPKKKGITTTPVTKEKFYWDEDKGYNHAISDCEDK